jgi:hypothetical protein
MSAAWILAGCATTDSAERRSSDSYGGPGQYSEADQINTVRLHDDVPIPKNFRLEPSKSLAFENQDTRVSVLHYKGRVDHISVVNFYKAHMSDFGWRLINLIEGPQTFLNFENSSEMCTITMVQSGGTTGLTISISPKSVNSAQSARAPQAK